MNALVKKEIRLLLPGGLAMLALEAVLPWIQGEQAEVIGMAPVFLFFGMVILAVDSFGREFSLGTFSSLMSQPIERSRLWRTKIAVLFSAAALIFAVCLASYGFHLHQMGMDVQAAWQYSTTRQTHESVFYTSMTASVAAMLVALTGGLWTVLLLRQAAAAFWITFLTPAGILVMLSLCLPAKLSNNDHVVIPLLYGLACTYAVTGFWFAHRLFHRVQDAGWTGGEIAFSKWRYFEGGSPSTVSTRVQRPFAALLKKELQMQSISWFCAAVFVVLHVGIIVMRKFYGHFGRDSLADMVSEFFWWVWLILPLVIGCTAMAEERRLGTMEGQACLPVSRRRQFTLKYLLAIFSGVLLGAAMPLLLEGLATLIGAPNLEFQPQTSTEYTGAIIALTMLALFLSFAGTYASTLTKSFLQAMGVAVVVIIGSVFFTCLGLNVNGVFGISLQPKLTIGLSILAVLLLAPWLSYRNFKHFQEPGRIWRRNAFGLVGTGLLIFGLSAAIYNRAWEVFRPAEPAHGAAKLTLANPPSLLIDSYDENVLVKLPDGRVWFDFLTDPESGEQTGVFAAAWRRLFPSYLRSGGPQRFLSGSNWVCATAQRVDTWVGDKEQDHTHYTHISGYNESFGIQPDGTLWVSEKSDRNQWTADTLTRFGDATDWQAARSDVAVRVLLLKKNGTLWQWGRGTNRFDWKQWPQSWPGLRSFQPKQIGTATDWQEFFPATANMVKKTDGSVWQVWFDRQVRMTNYDQIPVQNHSGYDQWGACVRDDGSLWVYGDLHGRGHDEFEMIQSGHDTNWVSVAVCWDGMAALKTDGTLWKWETRHRIFAQAFTVPPTRLGIHHDWVALAAAEGGVVSMAADGSLWFWPSQEDYRYDQTLMKLPKQPRFIANVFAKTK